MTFDTSDVRKKEIRQQPVVNRYNQLTRFAMALSDVARLKYVRYFHAVMARAVSPEATFACRIVRHLAEKYANDTPIGRGVHVAMWLGKSLGSRLLQAHCHEEHAMLAAPIHAVTPAAPCYVTNMHNTREVHL